ncbi:MAG: DUF401 family protein, partial [Promethearchaeota archaeon]
MEFIWHVPFIIRVLLSLTLLLIINRIVKRLSIAILCSILFLGLWSSHSIKTILEISWTRISNINTILLMFTIFLIINLSNQMSKTGVMKKLVNNIQSRLSQRASMVILPAVIGLLPMPGGAIFSAPLVADCDTENRLDPLLKTKINYWFRHIWEYWWPLFPGVLLLLDLTGISVSQLIFLQFPLTLTMLITGYFLLLKKFTPIKKINPQHKTSIKKILVNLLPIIIIIFTYVIIKIFFKNVIHYSKYLPIIIGII